MLQKIVMLGIALILSFGIAFATSTSNATTEQNNTYAMITGSVVDSQTGDAIPNATVKLTVADASTTTDEYGTFVFEQVETGTDTLSVEADGYQSAEKSVEITEEGANIEVELTPEM